MDTNLNKHKVISKNGNYVLFLPPYFLDHYKVGRTFSEIFDYKWIADYMRNFNKNDSIFVDVGANSGLATVPIALSGYDVLAFEPVAINVESLERAFEANSIKHKVKLVHAALSDKNGEQDIFVPYAQDNSSFNAGVAVSNMPDKSIVRPERVKLLSFDEYIKELSEEIIKKIRFIKIDVQGFEYPILVGMEKFVSKNKNIHIMVEWDEKHATSAGFNLGVMNDWFIKHNFKQKNIPFSGDRLYVKD